MYHDVPEYGGGAMNRQRVSGTTRNNDPVCSLCAAGPSTWVGAATATLAPMVAAIRAHVFAAGRLHADDTTVTVTAKDRTVTGRLWTYVRDDRPFAGPDPPAAVFAYSRDCTGARPERQLDGWTGVMWSLPPRRQGPTPMPDSCGSTLPPADWGR